MYRHLISSLLLYEFSQSIIINSNTHRISAKYVDVQCIISGIARISCKYYKMVETLQINKLFFMLQLSKKNAIASESNSKTMNSNEHVSRSCNDYWLNHAMRWTQSKNTVVPYSPAALVDSHALVGIIPVAANINTTR